MKTIIIESIGEAGAHLGNAGRSEWLNTAPGKETVIDIGGHRYILRPAREPEPVMMHTGKELYDRIEVPRGLIVDVEAGAQALHVLLPKYLESVRDLILTRRAEMLRAMGSDDLLDNVVYQLGDLPNPARSAVELITLITEHIEANRPELTDAVIGSEWEKVSYSHTSAPSLHFVYGMRAGAEYRSPAKGGIDEIGHTELLRDLADLRAENDDLKHRMAVVLHAGPATAIAAHAFDRAAKLERVVAELRAENERLKSETEKTKCSYNVWMTAAKSLGAELDALKAARSPQHVDDSDEYGILVQDGRVYLMKRKWMRRIRTVDWETNVRIVDVSGPLRIDPTRIFKVTSQPRGALKVPSEEDLKRASSRSKVAEAELFLDGSVWAIEWIKKANGAE